MSNIYEICIEGYLDPVWSDWLDGMAFTNVQGGRTILLGKVADQAALYGLLAKLRDMNLKLVYVQQKTT